jgi:hypothetical protein
MIRTYQLKNALSTRNITRNQNENIDSSKIYLVYSTSTLKPLQVRYLSHRLVSASTMISNQISDSSHESSINRAAINYAGEQRIPKCNGTETFNLPSKTVWNSGAKWTQHKCSKIAHTSGKAEKTCMLRNTHSCWSCQHKITKLYFEYHQYGLSMSLNGKYYPIDQKPSAFSLHALLGFNKMSHFTVSFSELSM